MADVRYFSSPCSGYALLESISFEKAMTVRSWQYSQGDKVFLSLERVVQFQKLPRYLGGTWIQYNWVVFLGHCVSMKYIK